MTGPTRRKLGERIRNVSKYIFPRNRDTHLRTWIRSSTAERAGVPETAKLETRGMRETISLVDVKYTLV